MINKQKLMYKILGKINVEFAYFVSTMIFFSFMWLGIYTNLHAGYLVLFSCLTVSFGLLGYTEHKSIKRLQRLL